MAVVRTPETGMSKSTRLIIVASVVSISILCGMFGPIAFGEHHRSAVWEPLYGIGFFVAGFIFHPYSYNQTIGLIGFWAWPLLVIIGLGFLTWRATAQSRHSMAICAALFAASLCWWVSDRTANVLSVSWVPFYFNYYATWY